MCLFLYLLIHFIIICYYYWCHLTLLPQYKYCRLLASNLKRTTATIDDVLKGLVDWLCAQVCFQLLVVSSHLVVGTYSDMLQIECFSNCRILVNLFCDYSFFFCFSDMLMVAYFLWFMFLVNKHHIVYKLVIICCATKS